MKNYPMKENTKTPSLSDGKKNQKKKPRKLAIILGGVLGALVLAGVGIGMYVYFNLSQMNANVTPTGSLAPETESIDPNLPNLSGDIGDPTANLAAFPAGVYHIMLYGLDTRSPGSYSERSDVNLLVTVDTRSKKVQLTSFMRDILVKLPDNTINRLNTAIVYNDPEKATQLIGGYFGIKLENYAVMNFWGVAKIINALGGVKVTVKDEELADLNSNLSELIAEGNMKVSLLQSAGYQNLNGLQAVAYMRIRHVGQADFQRTVRQRNVLNTLLKKMSNMSSEDVLKIVNILPQNMRTNLTPAQMIEFATAVYKCKGTEIDTQRIPVDNSYKVVNYNGLGGVLQIDFEKNAQALKEVLPLQ
jgi:polyisoprenyl-teichoic acid--peptidoglycan teichoic acid transferase